MGRLQKPHKDCGKIKTISVALLVAHSTMLPWRKSIWFNKFKCVCNTHMAWIPVIRKFGVPKTNNDSRNDFGNGEDEVVIVEQTIEPITISSREFAEISLSQQQPKIAQALNLKRPWNLTNNDSKFDKAAVITAQIRNQKDFNQNVTNNNYTSSCWIDCQFVPKTSNDDGRKIQTQIDFKIIFLFRVFILHIIIGLVG